MGDFCLRNKFVPKVDRERRVSAGEYCDEMPLECLYSPFCLVGSFGERGHELVLDVVYDEMLSQSFRCFVVHDLELDVVFELKKPLVSA
jgi:hypothetical protein